jgi:peptidylprolyl isomerase
LLRALAALCVVATCSGLAGCGGGDQDAELRAASTLPEQADSSLADVQVRGDVGKKPTVDVAAPFRTSSFVRQEIVQGTGLKVTSGAVVQIEYLGVNGTDGTVFDSTYERTQASTFTVREGGVSLPGILKAVEGANVGSRVLVAVPPQDGYGEEGMPALGIAADDTLILVVDVLSAKLVLDRAQGTPQPPVPGLPVVELAEDGAPTITLPSEKPPTTLVVDTRILGAGPIVLREARITVHYTGVTWPGGKVFDSSWEREETSQFTVGVGKLIPAWEAGLVGQTVGSQVLLVVPPAQGYGSKGNPSADISGTDTLVFVVDILDAVGGTDAPAPSATPSPSGTASPSASATASPSQRPSATATTEP